MKTIKLAALVLGIAITSIGQSFCQTSLQFTGISVTDEGAMHLAWSSVSNEVYEIDEADALIDTNTGSTTWNNLYDDYPSQGSNTFWLDTGNYNLAPQILQPRNSAMRFYRVVDVGPDSTSDEPSVIITSPSNNVAASDELTVTVVAATDQPVLSGTKLYVDGQEMRSPFATTNYTDSTGVTNYEADTYNLNTCEWGNEVHTLFATTECQSGSGDAVNAGIVATGHGISPFVSVLFSNLITRISFSQPSFDPASGQTQQVSAVFAANSDWTLNVADVYSNVVYTTSGSGDSMLVNWDGTSNGTNLFPGIYYYYIFAATNGESDALVSGGGGSGGGTPPSPDFSIFSGSDSDTEWWVTPSDGSGSTVPLALYPSGFNTNGLTIFEASSAEVASLHPSVSSFSSFGGGLGGGGGYAPDASGGSSSSSQGSPASPQRTPANPIVGISGLFGIAYDTYSANGTNVMSASPIPNIPGLPGSYIALDGYSASAHLTYTPLVPFKTEANNFVNEMQLYGWKNTIYKVDNQLNISDLRGSGTPFNGVSVGAFLSHGAYGNTQDYMAGLCKQMYFPVTAGGGISYLRMSEMSLGGSDSTNGLKWFAFVSCDSLHHANWNSMINMGEQCYNSNMHMVLGANSVISTSSYLLQYWARYMNYGRGSFSPLTVQNAWFQAAKDAYYGRKYDNTMVMAVAADSNCTGDYVEQGFNSAPGGTWGYTSLQVWP